MNKNDKARVKEIPFEDVVILPPKPGVCPICAVDHEPDQPHNRDSLYYQMKFRQQHGRFPTWADAMAHCDEHVKQLWIAALAERGVSVAMPKETADDKND